MGVVQLILASRMGTRELESDEEDENAFEVPREQLSKFTGKAPPTKLQLQEAIEKAAIEADKKQNNSSNDSKDNKNDADDTPVDEKKVESGLKTETEVEAKPKTTETSNIEEKMDVDKEKSSNEEEKSTNSETMEETKENNDSDKPEKMELNDEKPSENAIFSGLSESLFSLVSSMVSEF